MSDEVAFDAFYSATRRRLLGQLTLLTCDRDAAQDVVQDAYVKAWQHWGRVARMDDPEAWVRTVAFRLAVSRWRRIVVARKAQPVLAASEHAVSPATEQAMDVRAALALLPEGQRLVLVLHELCDLSVEDVSRQTGIRVGTVKTRLMRGRAALALLLAPTTEELGDVRPA